MSVPQEGDIESEVPSIISYQAVCATRENNREGELVPCGWKGTVYDLSSDTEAFKRAHDEASVHQKASEQVLEGGGGGLAWHSVSVIRIER